MMKSYFVGIREFRQNMSKIMDAAQKKKQEIIVLRRNQPAFRLVPLVWDEDGIYTDAAVRRIKEALKSVRAGKIHSQEEVKRKFGIK